MFKWLFWWAGGRLWVEHGPAPTRPDFFCGAQWPKLIVVQRSTARTAAAYKRAVHTHVNFSQTKPSLCNLRLEKPSTSICYCGVNRYRFADWV